jgi:hypothetical protein
MPSRHLIRQYADLFGVEKEWRWSGVHDQRTALDWLENFDTHRGEIERVFRKVHGGETGWSEAKPRGRLTDADSPDCTSLHPGCACE